MSTPLRALLHDLSDDETRAAATHDATEIGDRLRTQVRRRRTRRYVGTGGAVAAAAAAVLAASVLTSPAPTVPAEPSPSVTVTTPAPTPTPTPTPTATAAARVPLGPVTAHPDLPAAEALAAGDLEATTDEWQLALVQPSDGVEDPAPTVLYLLGPQGQRYEVPAPISWDGLLLDGWLPGTTLMVVAASDGAPELPKSVAPWRVVDMLTGDVLTTVDPDPDPWTAQAVHLLRDGSRDVLVTTSRWTGSPGSVVTSAERRTLTGAVVTQMDPLATDSSWSDDATVSSDGEWVLLATGPTTHIRSTRDLTVEAPAQTPYPEAPERCHAGSWLGGADLVVECLPDRPWIDRFAAQPTPAPGESVEGLYEDRVETWVVPVAGGAPTLLGTGVAALDHSRVGDQVYGLDMERSGDAWSRLVRFSGGATFEPVDVPGFETTFSTVSGGRLWVMLRRDDALDLVALDPATGATQVLWPDLFRGSRVSVEMPG